jgi:hypothetical protein
VTTNNYNTFTHLHTLQITTSRTNSSASVTSERVFAWQGPLWMEIPLLRCPPSPSPAPGQVNCCWSSPAQIFLFSGPIMTNDQIFLRSKIVYVFVNRVSSSTRGVADLAEQMPRLLHCNLARVYQHSHRVQVRAFVLYGPYTRFVTILQWITFMLDIHKTSVKEDFCSRSCLHFFFHSEAAASLLNGCRLDHCQV